MADKKDNNSQSFSLFSSGVAGSSVLPLHTLDMFRANMDDVCKLPPKTPQVNAVARASPEVGFADALSRAQFGNTPLQKMDIFFATLRDVTLSKVRGSILSEHVDKALTTMPAGVIKPIAYVVSGDWKRPGDRQFSERVAEGVDKYWDGSAAKPQKFGEYDVSMAVGWMPEGEIKVNGVKTKLTKPIDNLLAVFVRNPDGSVEILDPSVKAHSMGEFATKLLPLYFKLDHDNYADKKWAQTAGTYMAWQVLPMALSSGAGIGLKATGALTKSEQIIALTDTMNKASKIGTVSGMAQMGAAGANMAGVFHQKSVSDNAVDQLVGSLVASLRDPSKITPSSISKSLDNGLHQHTFNRNTTNSIYIPSLGDDVQPWSRLSQVLQGRVDGFRKPNNPWEDWKKDRNISVPDITKKLADSPEMMSVYYGNVTKALSGKPLTDQETFVVRLGKAVTYRSLQDIEGKRFEHGEMTYDANEKKQTIDSLRLFLRRNLVEDIENHPAIAKSLGVDLKKLGLKGKDEQIALDYMDDLRVTLPALVDDKVLGTYVEGMKSKADQTISQSANAKLEQDRLKAQGMAMALTIH